MTGVNLAGNMMWGFGFGPIDLSGADLSGANLDNAYLNETTLAGATLVGTSLEGAILNEADLSGAFLNGADLDFANLLQAILNGADLTGAQMWGADLSGADLSGSILSDISQYNTATWTDAFYDYRNEPTWHSAMDTAWRSGGGSNRVTPEPSTLLLALFGLALRGCRRRRTRG